MDKPEASYLFFQLGTTYKIHRYTFVTLCNNVIAACRESYIHISNQTRFVIRAITILFSLSKIESVVENVITHTQ